MRLLLCLISLLYATASPAQGPMYMEAAEDKSVNDDFAWRGFVNRTIHTTTTPKAIPAAEYFRTRVKQYAITGTTATRGTITGLDDRGELRFEGQYLRDHLDGPAKSMHPNGVLRDSGLLLMNLPEGEWRFYYPDGQLRSVRHYNAYMWWSLEWSIRLQNPFWNRFELSDLYNRNKNSFYEAVVASQTFNEPYSPLFEYCVQDGQCINYHPNGQVADSGRFFQGLRDGLWLYYRDDGSIKAKGAYAVGRKSKTWVYFYPGGGVERIEVYKRGEMVESKTLKDEAAASAE